MTMQLVERVELTSSQASITFSNIPQTYTDLLIVYSLRDNNAGASTFNGVDISINSSTSGISGRRLNGTGSSVSSGTTDYQAGLGVCATTAATSSVFANTAVYFPNYTSSVAKSFSIDSVTENNGTSAWQVIQAGLWTGTAAITSISASPNDGYSFVQYSSASLYGITKGSDGTTTVA